MPPRDTENFSFFIVKFAEPKINISCHRQEKRGENVKLFSGGESEKNASACRRDEKL
jgi:hypothetical protein